MNKNLLSQCFIKEGKFKPKVLGEEVEIKIRELTISENQQFREILQDETKTQNDAMFYAVKCAMIEPKFFSDEELEKVNVVGFNLIREVFEEIPFIGKTKKEREIHIKHIAELMKKSEENQEENLEDIEAKK